MFQFKNAGLGAKEPDASTALPNTFGKVRTFKEDLENFGKGAPAEGAPDPENFFQPEIKKDPAENAVRQPELPQPRPAVSGADRTPDNPFQSIPTPPPLSSANAGLPDFKHSPSQSFFAQKPAVTENILPENRENKPAPPKTQSKIILPLIVALVVVALGAGFYYYWFFLRSASPAVSSTPTTESVPTPAQTAQVDSPQTDNLRRLIVDTSQSPTEIKSAVEKFATEFATSTAENDLVEVKILGKDNLPIGKKDFFAGFGAVIPDSVLTKLSEDYSFFASKERDAVKLGFVFKTVTASGLDDEMKNWEPTIAKDLPALYAGQAPAGAGSFSSSRYKNADIRYFNFSSPTDTSLDYSIVSNFLVIGSSKDSTRAILDYMSGK